MVIVEIDYFRGHMGRLRDLLDPGVHIVDVSLQPNIQKARMHRQILNQGTITSGINSPATATETSSVQLLDGETAGSGRLSQIWALAEREIDAQLKKDSTAVDQVIVIDFASFEPHQQYRLPIPAPPPRLHFTTFWRSLTRRMYAKHHDEMILAARSTAMKSANRRKIDLKIQ